MKHEHNRSDRDDHVDPLEERIIPEDLYNFDLMDPALYRDFGPYDYESIMHYGPNAFAKPLRYDWDSGYTSATFFHTGGKDYLFLLRGSDGQSHVYRVQGKGKLGPKVKDYSWGAGYTATAAFFGGGDTLLLSLKKTEKKAWVNEIDSGSGEIGGVKQRPELGLGYTHATFFMSGGTIYLFLMKDDGASALHPVDASGTIGAAVDTHAFGADWTTAAPFRVGSKQRLFLLNGPSGIIEVHDLTGGRFGARVKRESWWNPGWSSVAFYYSSSKTYMMVLKASTGEVHIHEMRADGSVGREVERHGWSPGWTLAEPFETSGKSYMLLLKKGDGTAHVHQMWSAGQLGWEEGLTPTMVTKQRSKMRVIGKSVYLSRGDISTAGQLAYGHIDVSRIGRRLLSPVDCRYWSDGWTHGVPFSTGKGQFLLFFKGGEKRAEIRQVARSRPAPAAWGGPKPVHPGEIGDLVEEHWDWEPGWGQVSFYRANGTTYMVRLNGGSGVFSITSMTEDGKLDKETYRPPRPWSSGWTTATTMEIKGKPHLFLIKSLTGDVSISDLMPQGVLGEETYRERWSEGWTMATSYVVGGETYLFLMKTKNGDTSISHLVDGGIVGKEHYRKTKGAGFSHAVPFVDGGKQRILLFSRGTGKLEVRSITRSGKRLGGRWHRSTREVGYSNISVFTVAGSNLLLSMRSNLRGPTP